MSAFSLVCGTGIICELLLIFFHPPKRNRESFLCQRTQIGGEWCDTIFAILISVYLVFNSLCFRFDRHYYQTPIFLWYSTTGLREDLIYLLPILTYAAFKQEIFQKRQAFPTLLTRSKYLEYLSQTSSHGVLPEQRLSLSSLDTNKEGRNLLFFSLEVALRCS